MLIFYAVLAFAIPLAVIASPETEDLTIKFVEPIETVAKDLQDIEQQVQHFYISTRKVAQNVVARTQLMAKNSEKFEIEVPSIEMVAPSPVAPASGDVVPDASAAVEAQVVVEKPKEDNVSSAITNLQDLDQKLGTTFKDLRNRKRYILAAMVRQMQTTVKNVRSNMMRAQSQFTLAQTASKQTTTFARPLLGANQTDAEREKLLQDNQDIIVDVEERIQSVSKRINDIVSRLSLSLATPANEDVKQQPLNPITTLNTIINQQKTVTRAMMHAQH